MRVRYDRYIIWLVLVLFLCGNVFDMNGRQGWKYIGFYALAPIVFTRAILGPPPRRELVIYLLLFLFWPLVALGIGLLRGAEPSAAISQTTPFAGAAIGLFVAHWLGRRAVLQALYIVLLAAAVFSIIVNAAMLVAGENLFVQWAVEHVSCDMSPRLERFYLSATLWFVPVAVYFGVRRNVVLCSVGLFALMISSSRAGFAIAVAGIGISYIRNFRQLLGFGTIATILMTAMIGLPGAKERASEVTTRDRLSDSANVRINDVAGILVNYDENPGALFLGLGAGVPIFALGHGGYETRIEFDHLDATLKYGLPWFMAFSVFFVSTFKRLRQSPYSADRAHCGALMAMFLAAGTNPQLVSPLFMFYLWTCRPLAERSLRYPAEFHAAVLSSSRGRGCTAAQRLHNLP